MAWTTPKIDWTTGELVTAADLNTMNENLAALKQPATAVYTTTADITADVREFTDIDSDNLNLTITTAGGDVLLHFHGSMVQMDKSSMFLDIEVDGTRLGGDDGILKNEFRNITGDPSGARIISFTRLFQGLGAGSHTFKLLWRGTRGSKTLRLGAQFWVREI
ncbi:MAG: hypothetical protein OXE52_00775 [Chloroflexi bacterium]|nr:hypothetical protein [Chloroflexota bacterium]